MFHVTVCSNDHYYIDIINKYLGQISRETGYIFNIQNFHTPQKFIQNFNSIQNSKLHLLIIDMDTDKDEYSGIGLAKIIRSLPSCKDMQILLFSNYIMNSLVSYEVQPFHFFLKPICFDNFNDKILALCGYILSSINRYLIVKSEDEQIVLRTKEIMAIEKEKESSIQKRLKVVTKEEDFIVRGTLKEFLLRLGEPFIHIHRSIIVNIEYVHKFKNQNVIMKNNKTYPIGRSKKNLIRDSLFLYQSN